MKSDTMHNSKKDKKRHSAGHENTRGCFLLPYKKTIFTSSSSVLFFSRLLY